MIPRTATSLLFLLGWQAAAAASWNVELAEETQAASSSSIVSVRGRSLVEDDSDPVAALQDSKGADHDAFANVFIPTTISVLNVHIPASLRHPEGEGHVVAHFGNYPSHGSLTQFVYYTNQTLCSFAEETPAVLLSNFFPNPSNGWVRPFVLLVTENVGLGADQEDCNAVSIARVAQSLGAAAVLLGEPHCRCDDPVCASALGNDTCIEHDPPFVDDGSAGDITIPTVLVRRILASQLAEHLQTSSSGSPALVEFTWGLPVPEDTGFPDGVDWVSAMAPHYQLWTTAHDPLLNIGVYKSLRTLSKAFAAHAHFEPRYAVIDGAKFGCLTGETCLDMCTNGGRYCAVPVTKDEGAIVTGATVVVETLRRLCIWQHYPSIPSGTARKARKEKFTTHYFDYIIYHLEHCSSSASLFDDEKCVAAAYKAAKVDAETIQGCMSDTGATDQSSANSLLDLMMKKQENRGITRIPTLTVDNDPLSEFSSKSLFDALCMKYFQSTVHSPFVKEERESLTIPSLCETCSGCPNVVGCVEHGGKCVPFDFSGQEKGSSKGSSGKSGRGGRGWFWFLFVLLLVGGGAYYYFFHMRDEFGDRRGLLDGYLQLAGGSS